MCWAHVFRNIRPKLAAIRKANPTLGASMLADIESIQWMVESEAEFTIVCEKFKLHYLEQDLSELERKLVSDFITYFLGQWGPGSHAANWYAGAHPFSLTNNQVLAVLPFFKCFAMHFIKIYSGLRRDSQRSQSQSYLPNRASIGPVYTDAGATGISL